jgi:hypothetical protein
VTRLRVSSRGATPAQPMCGDYRSGSQLSW